MSEEKKVKVDKTEARFAYLERKVAQFERVKNWLETIHGADIDGDSHIGAPKEGSVMTKLLVSISAFCILCGSLFAGVLDDKSAGTGTYTLSQSSIGTGDITLTVDAVAADVTGDVTGNVTGNLTGSQPVQPTTTITTNAYVLTSANYGSSILVNTNAAVAITLPANGAAVGSWVEVGVIGTDDCAPTISAATADTLIGPNDIDLDSVTWATGHRINALARFWSDGAKWHVLNLGGTTMTYTD